MSQLQHNHIKRRTVTVQQVRVWIFSEIAAFLSHLRMRTPYSSCQAEFFMWDVCPYIRQLGMDMWLEVIAHTTPRRLQDTHSSELAAAFIRHPWRHWWNITAPLILNLETKLRWALSHTPRPLHHRHQLDRCMSRSRSWSGLFQKENLVFVTLLQSKWNYRCKVHPGTNHEGPEGE